MTTAIQKAQNPDAAFLLFDKLDDEQILAEMQGAHIKSLVYSYTQGGQLVEGLSKAGVDAVVREMAARGEVIRELTCDVTETPDEYLARVLVGRYVREVTTNGEIVMTQLDTVLGVKRQPKMGTRRDGSEYKNEFAYEQAVMKAARNARRRMIPEELALQLITKAKAGAGVRQVRREEVEEAGEERPPQKAKAVPAAPVDHWAALEPEARTVLREKGITQAQAGTFLGAPLDAWLAQDKLRTPAEAMRLILEAKARQGA